MPVYLDVLMVLNFLVDFCLLLGTNRLAGYPSEVKKSALAAALGGLYGGVCVLPGWQFLSGSFWRLTVLVLMAGIVFGWNGEALRRGIVFVLLTMALGGVAMGFSDGNFWTLSLSALAVGGMCVFGFRGHLGAEYLPVELEGIRFTALRDTGNSLTDPITGQQVLVVSSQVAKQLLNLSERELANPCDALGKVESGRLIPYHAVGKSGILLAKRYENVTIGKWKGSTLVGFSPSKIGQGKLYEALMGGAL